MNNWRTIALITAMIAAALPKSSSAEHANDHPTGTAGSFNGDATTGGGSIIFTTNAKRSITDFVMPGSVGAYPLAFTRTSNSRYTPGLKTDFGEPGGWSHSYRWSIDSEYLESFSGRPVGMPESYTVNYPDGDRVIFYRAEGDRYLRAGPGIGERFQPPPFDGGYCYLILPDGGKIRFLATIRREYDAETRFSTASFDYDFTGIIDPHGLVTEISRPAFNTVMIKEPAGRWIKLIYSSWVGEYSSTIIRLEASDGRVIRYGYFQMRTSTHVPYVALVRVDYPGGYPNTASYTYQDGNIDPDGRPLLRSCDDPMYAGPMQRIRYQFVPGSSTDVYGHLDREYVQDYLYFPTVSAISAPDPNTRIETRGDGPSRTLTYSEGRLATWTDFKGAGSSQGPDVNGFIASVTDANGHTTNFENHPLTGARRKVEHPATASDGGRAARTIIYGGELGCPDLNNQDLNQPYYVCATTDERNNTTIYWREPDTKRVYWIDYPDGSHEEFAYNHFGQVTWHRMTSAGIETFRYDDYNGQLLEYRDPYHQSGPPSATYTYYQAGHPSAGRMESVTDARGHRTDYEYNLRGQVTKVIHPPDPVTGQRYFIQREYNPDGTLAWEQDEDWVSWNAQEHRRTYTYDAYKRVTSATDGRGKVTRFDYKRFGTWSSYLHTASFVFRRTTPMGKIFDHDCDDNLRVRVRRDAPFTSDDAITFYEHDNAGNLLWVRDPRGNYTQFGYDERNRRTSATDALDRSTFWLYDRASNKVSEQRPDGGVTTWDEYDPMNRLKQSTVTRDGDPANNVVTQMRYEDEARNLTSMIDPRGQTYGYGYDLLNRKRTATYPPGAFGVRSEVWTYNDVGNLETFQNRAGNVQTFVHDNRNRETHFSWDDGRTNSRSVSYYPSGPMKRVVTSGNDANDFTYDGNNQMLSDAQTSGGMGWVRTTRWTYDDDGNRATITHPHGASHTYEYTRRNQLQSMRDTGAPGVFLWYSYDESGNRKERLLGNGTRTDYAPADSLNRISGIQHGFAGGVGQRYDYDFDVLNRLRFERRNWNNDETDGYSYDQMGQVTGHIRAGSLQGDGTVAGGLINSNTVYDANGNRATYHENGGTRVWTPNELSQYSNDSLFGAIQHDATGNVTNYNGARYVYDAQNRLVGAHFDSINQHVNYYYDGLNRQILRYVDNEPNGPWIYSTWDGWNLAEEWNVNGGIIYTYTHGGAQNEMLVRNTPTGAAIWYHQDGRSNTSHLSDNAGELLERNTYSLFGRALFFTPAGVEMWESAYKNRHLFAGADYVKQTAMYDMRNRFYHTGMSRFAQPDPIGFAGDPTNLYRYCGNDPVNFFDPFGLEPPGFVPPGNQPGKGPPGGPVAPLPRDFGTTGPNIPTNPAQAAAGAPGQLLYHLQWLQKNGYGNQNPPKYQQIGTFSNTLPAATPPPPIQPRQNTTPNPPPLLERPPYEPPTSHGRDANGNAVGGGGGGGGEGGSFYNGGPGPVFSPSATSFTTANDAWNLGGGLIRFLVLY